MAQSAAANPVFQAETTSDDRTMAVLAHALQVFFGWLAPLIIFFVQRQSRFVAFHSLQVLFLELIFLVINMCLMAFVVAGVLVGVMHHYSGGDLWTALLAVFPVFFLGNMGLTVVKVVIAVVYSIKAGRGEWAEYPVLGGWARSVLKIGPGGAAFEP